MRIDRLSITGVLRFPGTLSLDLREIPPGLVAIVGANGAGKTSLLESMFAAFWQELPSRSDRELVDYALGKDSALEVEAFLEGKGSYRARLNLDGLRRTKDAVLERTDLAGSRALLNDGKVSTFTAAVSRELPSKATVLASAFASQNRRGSFAVLDKRGRKDLFSELLGLEHFEAMAETARLASQHVDRRIAELRSLIEHLAPTTTDAQADQLGETGNRLQVRLTTLEQRKAELEGDLDRAIIAEGQSREAAETAETMALERERLQRALDGYVAALRVAERAIDASSAELAREQAAIVARRDRAITSAREQIAAVPNAEGHQLRLDARVTEIRGDFAVRRADLNERIANNQDIQAQGDAIRAGIAEVESAEAKLAEAIAAVEACQRKVDDVDAVYSQAGRDRVQLAPWPARLQSAETRAQLLERAPFGVKCEEAACAFVKDAIEAKASLEDCRAGVEDFRTAEAAEHRAHQDCVAARADLADAQRAVRELRTGLQHPDIAKLRQRLVDLNLAESRVKERTEQRAQLDADETAALGRARADHDDRRKADDALLARLDALVVDAQAAALDEQTALETRIADTRWVNADALEQARRQAADTDAQLRAIVVDVEAQDRHGRAVEAMERVRKAQHQTAVELATLDGEITRFDADRAAFQKRQAQRDRLEQATRALETDLIEWQALARVLGRDGLPVLEIDAAGPAVSDLTNDLLASCFDGRFSVELVTQEAKARGQGFKEAFDLKVYDGQQGGAARNLSDLSGGEQVLVDESLKSAIALFVNSRNAQPFRTWWRDETTGALDQDNALRYIAMLRRAHARGGLHHLFFISHNAEAAALADVQLHVHDGRVDVVYSPFKTATEAA
jgi:exonuclease SbcC